MAALIAADAVADRVATARAIFGAIVLLLRDAPHRRDAAHRS
jgi:hypothetical protein